jgi:hypothetical protein
MNNDDILCAMASEIVQTRSILIPEVYPATDAKELVARLKSESAKQWRMQISAFSWRQKLMVIQEARREKGFAARLEPCILEWIEWKSIRENDGKSANFSAIWNTLAEQCRLTREGLDTIRDWLLLESKNDRYWSVAIISRPVDPGLGILLSANENSVGETEEVADTMVDFSQRMRIKTYKNSYGRGSFVQGHVLEGELTFSESNEVIMKEQVNQFAQIADATDGSNSSDPIVGIEILFNTYRRPMVHSRGD